MLFAEDITERKHSEAELWRLANHDPLTGLPNRMLAQHKLDPTRHLHGIMELASLYDAASLDRALLVATEYNTYSHTFVRGVLEHRAAPTGDGAELSVPRALPVAMVQPDLSRYQRVLEVAR